MRMMVGGEQPEDERGVWRSEWDGMITSVIDECWGGDVEWCTGDADG